VTVKAVAAMALALAACSGPRSSAEAQCRRQATQDPAVQAIYSRGNGYYTFSTTPQQAELEEATRQAVIRCMREKGLIPPGGVQPVVPH
jgi:hypothetical protein